MVWSKWNRVEIESFYCLRNHCIIILLRNGKVDHPYHCSNYKRTFLWRNGCLCHHQASIEPIIRLLWNLSWYIYWYIGLLDTLKQIGKFFGCIWLLLMPFIRPKRGFFIFNSVKCVLFCMLILGTYMGSLVKPIYCLMMPIIGFVKAIAFLPNVYISKYWKISVKNMDAQKEKMKMTIFNGTVSLGDVFGLLLGELIIN